MAKSRTFKLFPAGYDLGARIFHRPDSRFNSFQDILPQQESRRRLLEKSFESPEKILAFFILD